MVTAAAKDWQYFFRWHIVYQQAPGGRNLSILSINEGHFKNQQNLCPSGYGPYIVEPEDTLGGIARRYGTTIDVLIAVNPGINFQPIQAGQLLCIPGFLAVVNPQVETTSLSVRINNCYPMVPPIMFRPCCPFLRSVFSPPSDPCWWSNSVADFYNCYFSQLCCYRLTGFQGIQ